MKKNLASFFLVTLLFALVGCAGGTTATETATFEKEQSGTTIRLVYTYQGDKVLSQTSEITLPYSALGVTTKEEAQTIMESVGASAYEGITGLTHSIEYTDTDLVEKTTVDYETVNVSDIAGLPDMDYSGNISNSISMEQSRELLVSQGYTEVK